MSDSPTSEVAFPSDRATRANSVGVWVVLVIAGILLLLTAFAVWVDRVALNTDVLVDTSTELIEDDAIRQVVAARAVDEIFDNVDVQTEIEGRLPEDYQGLSGPAAAGLREASYRLVERAFQQPALQRLWALSLEQSHETLLAVLEDDVPAFSTTGGVVTLDLERIVLEAADRIGIRDQVEGNLPEDVGRIEILESDELDTAQNAFQLLKTLAWVLPLLTLAAFLVAVWIARDRRRAVRRIGVVVLVTGLLGLIAAQLVGGYIVGSLTAATEVRTAASNAWDILTELLRISFRWFVVVGILLLVAAWLAGPGARAVAGRRALAPALRARVWPYATLGALILLLLLVSPATDFVRLLVLVVLAALATTWIELTRRQALHEFPEADGRVLLESGRARLTSWWEAQRGAYTERRERTAATAAATPTVDLTARLAALADLHARGELTDAEYASAKARVLAGD